MVREKKNGGSGDIFPMTKLPIALNIWLSSFAVAQETNEPIWKTLYCRDLFQLQRTEDGRPSCISTNRRTSRRHEHTHTHTQCGVTLLYWLSYLSHADKSTCTQATRSFAFVKGDQKKKHQVIKWKSPPTSRCMLALSTNLPKEITLHTVVSNCSLQ